MASSRTVKFARRMKEIAKFLRGYDHQDLKRIPEDLNDKDKQLYNSYAHSIGLDGQLPSAENVLRFVGKKILKTHTFSKYYQTHVEPVIMMFNQFHGELRKALRNGVRLMVLLTHIKNCSESKMQ